MTDYGETSTGFRGKTFDEAGTDIRARMRARIDPNLTLDEKDPLGTIVDVFSDELALAWEALEIARNQFDPDNAEGQGAVALASLTGTIRRNPTKGTVLCTLNLAASKTFAPGALVAHVNGEPTNRWVNRDTVTSTTAGNYTNQVFIAETAGYYPAAIGTLTKIAVTASGWNSITNTAAATVGLGLETIPELMVRRESELGSQAKGTLKGMLPAIKAVTGVIDAQITYNDLPVTVGGIVPNGLLFTIWDGVAPAASNNEIAQAILDNKSAGAYLEGGASGTAVDGLGATKTVYFDRALYTVSYVSVSVTAKSGTNGAALATDIRNTVIAAWTELIGAGVYASKLIVAVSDLEAVVDITSLTVGTSASPVTTSIPPLAGTVRLKPTSGNISVTVTVL